MRSIIKSVRGGAVIAVCVAIAGYTCYEARNLVLGPILQIEQPISGMSTKQPIVEIHGTARNITSITLNDRPITTDESGVFKEEITLSPGYNITKVTGKDRFGREKKILIEITRQESKEQLVYKNDNPSSN